MGLIGRIRAALIGEPEVLAHEMVMRYPELARLRLRRGGLPPRVGGWALGRTTVAAITLRQWVFLAPDALAGPPLLLHELRHVEQFEASPLFPVRYLWASLRHGYHDNPFEADARDYSARRLRALEPSSAGDR
ncbi:MAG TPA: hypothetical protein VJ650_13990 [Gemmatimonadaceae bacterium]|nr:hypothetical protein [Gemmatimonadaceae bacterium]